MRTDILPYDPSLSSERNNFRQDVVWATHFDRWEVVSATFLLIRKRDPILERGSFVLLVLRIAFRGAHARMSQVPLREVNGVARL